MVKDMLRPIEKTLRPLNNFLRNEYVTAVVALFVVLYASNVAPRLPDVVSDLFNNPIFRVFVLFLVAYIANKNPAVALLVSIAFVVTLNVINRQEAEEGFLDVIDTFNGGSERFSNGAAASPACSAVGGDEWQTTCMEEMEKNQSDRNTNTMSNCCNCGAQHGFSDDSKSCEQETGNKLACQEFATNCKAVGGEEVGEEDHVKKYEYRS